MEKEKQSLGSAFHNAFMGLRFIFISERNAKIHLVATILVIIAAIFFKITKFDWLAIVFAIGFVWVSESLNTAIEKITDLASPEYHELARITKDTAAAAVLLASITSAIIGFIVFIPRFIQWISNL